MISVSKNRLLKIIKIGLIILSLYMVGFFSTKAITFVRYYYEKKELTKAISDNKIKIAMFKQKNEESIQQINDLKSKYTTQEALAKKLKGIFYRMSLPDYNLKYITSTQLCINRYAIMVQLNTNSSNGLKAGEGILSYLGKIHKSAKKDNIYFVDYILDAEDK
ncbi:MAG: hypothetical protein ACNI28_09755 [Arcobacter sp.]|uniref:hypothetical protein n=1 Tax=Arcobacter sp. TaxID=1872629 RepID=UPI003AFFF2F8